MAMIFRQTCGDCGSAVTSGKVRGDDGRQRAGTVHVSERYGGEKSDHAVTRIVSECVATGV